MVKTLAKLEAKYQVPEHKRKKRLFSRKQRTNPIAPRSSPLSTMPSQPLNQRL